MNKPLLYIGVAMLCIAAAGCAQKSKDNGVSLSGTITAAVGNATDSDVNDSNAPYSSNNTPAQAQILPNPVVTGGFVAMPGTVKVGRLAGSNIGDQNDYYSVALFKGQAVSLTIGDRHGDNYSHGIGDEYDSNDIANKPGNIIDLNLLDSNQSLVASTANNDAAEVKSLTAPASGLYYLQVKAVTGASDYLVDTGSSACAAGATALSASGALNINDEFVPGEVIVRFKADSSQAIASQNLNSKSASVGLLAKAGAPGRSMLMALGDSVQRQQALSTLGVQAKQKYTDAKNQLKYETLQVIKALRARADVEYAKPNYIRHPTVDPNDLYYNLQWNLPLINWPQVWDTTTAGGSGVIVAVIDTGILPAHPDFNPNRLVAGFDFIRDITNAGDGNGIDNDPTDPGESGIYHGTHVAGIIAAETNNAKGVAGVAWNARIMPLRVLGNGGGTDYDIEQAVLYAAGLPNDAETAQQTADRVAAGNVASVINMSLGGPIDTTVAPTAYKQARERGVIIVAAAGNDASCGLSYPASFEGVVSVSAVGPDKTLASYSNYGPTVDVAAPGGSLATGVYSTWGTVNSAGTLVYDYADLRGTSMAAPHVAGVVALMKSVNPNLTPDIFDSLLVNGKLTQDLGGLGRDNAYGYGLIDAQLAVQSANLDVQLLSPALVVTPLALQFDPGVVQLPISMIKGGGGQAGDLVVTSLTSDSSSWLVINKSADVDPGTNLGTYIINIDRGTMPQQPSVGALITVSYQITDAQQNTTTGTQYIPVVVSNQGFVADAGYQYVLLYDTETLLQVRAVGASMKDGKYTYDFTQVPPGTYYIISGSDLNNNDSLNDKADAKGEYPYLGRIAEITVGNENIHGLDFKTGYSLVFTNGLPGNTAIIKNLPYNGSGS